MNAVLLATALLCPCSDMKDGSSARTPEPFVIDFAPVLTARSHGYSLHVHFKGRDVYLNGCTVFGVGKDMTATELRDSIYRDVWNNLCVRPIGKTKLAIYMHIEGNPVSAVKVSGVPVIVTPKNSYRENPPARMVIVESPPALVLPIGNRRW